MKDTRPYEGLTPELVLESAEIAGFRCDGSLLSMNSYENRVYRVGIEDGDPIIIKFYRPHRWSDDAILEEHDFSLELQDRELPVVAPMLVDHLSLLTHGDFRFAIYPLCPGRWPELASKDERLVAGRFLARIHAVGRTAQFDHRPSIDIERQGREPVRWLLEHRFIPDHLIDAYCSLTDDLFPEIERCFEMAGEFRMARIHGDCHPGNILWADAGPHFVDMDDCMTGPAVQDLWMLLSGHPEEMRSQAGEILEGYQDFLDFDFRELWLVEALRTLRLMHYSAWIAKRWHDPAFPKAFPWFSGVRYWEDHILTLREQAALMQEPPLVS